MQSLRFKFSHDPRHPGVGSIAHQLSISVYGPNGARGTRHNNKDQSPIISTNWASPGYLSGVIESGEWVVEIDVHRILPPGQVTYLLEVEWSADVIAPPPTEPKPNFPTKKKRRGPGWYSGDLHGHTLHSDGDYCPAEYLAVAHSRGYDFVALTDHNTFSGVPELKQLAGDTLTVIGGEELTTFNGHALVLGLEGITEWRVKEGATMSGLAKNLQAAGALFIIAHPKAEGHPFCTGCRWAYSDMFPGPARHVEIWNRNWSGLHNEQAVQLFYQWLNTRLRMVATGGTDTHRPMPDTVRIPINRVYAQDNTQKEILAAIKRGHSFVSSGPDISLTAVSHDGTQTGMGDIALPGKLELKCGWQTDEQTEPLEARIISQVKQINCRDCKGQTQASVALEAEAGQWFVLELRDGDGGLHAVSNPIFIGQNIDDWR